MKTGVVVIRGGAIGAAVAHFLKLLDSRPRASGGIRRLFSLLENIELSIFSIPFFDNFAETMTVDGVKADINLKLRSAQPPSLPQPRHGGRTEFCLRN